MATKTQEVGADAQGTKRALVEGLNTDLAHEWQAVIQYTTFASLLTGHSRPELRQFFQSEVQEELGHALFLADKVTALGGQPTTVPAEVPAGRGNREMVELALEAEKETIQRYKERIDQADAYGDIGLRVRLEDIVSDETQHKEDMERILADWQG